MTMRRQRIRTGGRRGCVRKRWPDVAGITAFAPIAGQGRIVALTSQLARRTPLRHRSVARFAPGRGTDYRSGERGKNGLLKYCLEWFLLQGYEALTSISEKPKTKDAIKDRAQRGTTRRPQLVSFRSFGKFNDALNAYLKRKPPNDNERTARTKYE